MLELLSKDTGSVELVRQARERQINTAKHELAAQKQTEQAIAEGKKIADNWARADIEPRLAQLPMRPH